MPRGWGATSRRSARWWTAPTAGIVPFFDTQRLTETMVEALERPKRFETCARPRAGPSWSATTRVGFACPPGYASLRAHEPRAGRSTVGAADPGVLDQRLQAIIGTDPDLRDLYVLRGDPFEGRRPGLDRKQDRLPALVRGDRRVAFPNINCFGPEYLDVLNTRLASGATTLEDYVRKLDALDDGAGAPTGVRGSHLPLLRGAVPSTTSPALARHGVSIVGFPTHTLGLGEDARSLFKVLRSLGLAVDLVDVGNPGLERIMEAEAYEPYLSARPSFPTVIFCMPMFQWSGCGPNGGARSSPGAGWSATGRGS